MYNIWCWHVSLCRLKDAIVSNEVSTATLSCALRSLDLLRSTLHAYNKKIAEVGSGHLSVNLFGALHQLDYYFLQIDDIASVK